MYNIYIFLFCLLDKKEPATESKSLSTANKCVREVPVDVPSDPKLGSMSPNHPERDPSPANVSSPRLEKLKCLAKLTDLKSYTGKSLTLQPSILRRGVLDTLDSPQMRSLRSPNKSRNPNQSPHQNDFNIVQSQDFRVPSQKTEPKKGLFVVNKSQKSTKNPKSGTTSKAVSRSLERDRKNSAKATSIGQEISAMIHSWGN